MLEHYAMIQFVLSNSTKQSATSQPIIECRSHLQYIASSRLMFTWLTALLFRARESILHVLAEQHAWLTKYCVESAGDGKNEVAMEEGLMEPVLSTT